MTQSVAPRHDGAAPDRGAGRHGGTLLVELLAEHGVSHVFGMPGGQTIALYDAMLDREDMAHVLVRDERTAAYAADGYARTTGLVGVCDATVGPGAAKLPSGLGESLGASVPVVALVSELPDAMAPHRYRGAASQALDQADHPVEIGSAEKPALMRHTGGHDHARGHRLPVQPASVPGGRLDGMPEGVAEVEQGALAALVLIVLDDGRLDFAGAADDVREGEGIAREQRLRMCLHPLEDGPIPDQAGFATLPQA